MDTSTAPTAQLPYVHVGLNLTNTCTSSFVHPTFFWRHHIGAGVLQISCKIECMCMGSSNDSIMTLISTIYSCKSIKQYLSNQTMQSSQSQARSKQVITNSPFLSIQSRSRTNYPTCNRTKCEDRSRGNACRSSWLDSTLLELGCEACGSCWACEEV